MNTVEEVAAFLKDMSAIEATEWINGWVYLAFPDAKDGDYEAWLDILQRGIEGYALSRTLQKGPHPMTRCYPRTKRFRKALRQFFCRHRALQFTAGTGAQLCLDGGNVEVGVIARCGSCDRSWTGEVRAACAEAYGKRSQDTPKVWPPVERETGTGGRCGSCGHSPVYVRGELMHAHTDIKKDPAP